MIEKLTDLLMLFTDYTEDRDKMRKCAEFLFNNDVRIVPKDSIITNEKAVRKVLKDAKRETRDKIINKLQDEMGVWIDLRVPVPSEAIRNFIEENK